MDKFTNIERRIHWLKELVEGQADIDKIDNKSLQSAKAFCGYSVDGLFDAIAYNTVKNHLCSLAVDKFGHHLYADNFRYFLELRRRAFEKLNRVSCSPKQAADPPDWKVMFRNALWQSNLCALAYMSLKRDVEAVLNSGEEDARLDYRKLEKVLRRSASTFSKVISQEPESISPDLKIVQGAKK